MSLRTGLTAPQFEEDVNSWEDYVRVARDILSRDVTADEFRDAFVGHFVPEDAPSWADVIDETVREMLEERGIELDDLSVEEQKELYDEAMEESRDEVSEALKTSLNRSKYSSIAEDVLEVLEENEDGVLE